MRLPHCSLVLSWHPHRERHHGERAIELLAGALEIQELTVAEDAPVARRTLEEVSLPRGALVLSDESGDRIAGFETMLLPGRTYILVTEPESKEEVRQLFRG